MSARFDQDMSLHSQKFLCIEPEDMQLQGDYSTNSASMVELRVEKCQGHDYCKNETEIDEYFATDKYVVLLSNQIRFESKLHHEASMIRESVLHWMPLDTEGLFR